MTSIDDISKHIDVAGTRADDCLVKAQGAATDAEQVVGALGAAKVEADAVSQELARLSIASRASEASQVARRAEELTGTARTTKSALDSSVDRLGSLKNELVELRTQTEALRGLLRAAQSQGSSATPSERAATPHPIYRKRAQFGSAPSTDYKKTFFDKHPHTKGNVVVHHAVEQQVQNRYPGVVNETQMHSYENLRGIPKGEINNTVHLSQIRKSWNRFYKKHPNPTQEQLLDHATEIDNMFGSRFDPPVR